MSFEKEINNQKNKYLNSNPVESKNKEYRNRLILKDTKVIIVGTITPPNRNFYYESPQNPIYKILDKAIEGANFLKYKKGLRKEETRNDSINKIIEELNKNKIGFLDVIERAYNPSKSAYDKDLKNITLDGSSFKNLKGKKILVNSKNAEIALTKHIFKNKKIDYTFLPQDRFHINIDDWIRELKKVISK